MPKLVFRLGWIIYVILHSFTIRKKSAEKVAGSFHAVPMRNEVKGEVITFIYSKQSHIVGLEWKPGNSIFIIFSRKPKSIIIIVIRIKLNKY